MYNFPKSQLAALYCYYYEIGGRGALVSAMYCILLQHHDE